MLFYFPILFHYVCHGAKREENGKKNAEEGHKDYYLRVSNARQS